MPTDTSIYQLLQPPRRERPLQLLSELVNAQKAIADLRTQQQEDADRTAMRQVFAESGGNMDAALERLRTTNPVAAFDLEAKIAGQQKTRLDSQRSRLELQQKQLDTGLQILQGMDEGTFAIGRRRIQAIDPDVAEMLGDTYDPARIERVLRMSLAAKDALAEPELKQVTTIDDQGREGTQFVQPTPGAFYPKAPTAAKTAAIGSFEDYVTRYATGQGKTPETLTPADIEDARKRYQQADDRPITVNTGGPRPITQTAEANLVTQLNRQWTTASKPARELASQLETMRHGLAAAERGDMAQGTEAVLQPFLKILDPNSVVREGEFFRLREGQSYLARAQGILQRLTQGGFVPLAELKKYAALAEEIATRQDSYVAGVRSRIGKVADRYSIPSELVFEAGAAPTDEGALTPPPAPAPRTTTTGTPKVGDRRLINGQLAEWKTINGQSGWVAVR